MADLITNTPGAPTEFTPHGAVIFHARGFMMHIVTGLGMGLGLLAGAVVFGQTEIANAPPGLNAVAIAARAAEPICLAFSGVFLLFIAVTHMVRKAQKPMAFRMDEAGVEGFLMFGRRRIDWRDITEVKYQGPWIHLIAGKKKLFLNTDQLQWKNGLDPRAVIDYFLNRILRPV